MPTLTVSPFAEGHVEVAAGADRGIVLGDLVPLREVGVEVVLAGEDGLLGDVAVEREPGHHAQLYGLLVGDRQRARVPEADRAGVRVRRLAVGHPAAAEHLGRRRKVDVELQPYDRPVRPLLLHFQVIYPSISVPSKIILASRITGTGC